MGVSDAIALARVVDGSRSEVNTILGRGAEDGFGES
jgi:hypothetical protein